MNNGILYLIATPIGNLDDFTTRAVETLKQVDLVAAEDTRHSSRLFQYYGISTSMISLHEHNEKAQANHLILRLQQGESIAVVSDAGTPLISDPGAILVAAAHEAGIQVVPIPGPCAAIAALSASGLSTDQFVFIGFLPPKQSARIHALQMLVGESRTMIFYESPHRVLDCLIDLIDVFGENRLVTMARELTKRFETIRLSTLSELHQWMIEDTNQQKGEFVLVVAGKTASKVSQSDDELKRVLTILLDELPTKTAASLAAKITGSKRNHAYDVALAMRK